jgi:hypothetical protein
MPVGTKREAIFEDGADVQNLRGNCHQFPVFWMKLNN